MARFWFGAGIADYVVAPVNAAGADFTVAFQPAATVTFWDSQVGGRQLVDLLDSVGTATDHATADDNGALSARIQGPDGLDSMWADGGDPNASRVLMMGDLTGVAAQAAQAATDAAAASSGLASAPVWRPANNDDTYPPRLAGTRPHIWIGPKQPTDLQPLDEWHRTAGSL